MTATPNLKTYIAVHLATIVLVCVFIIVRYALKYDRVYKRFSESMVTTCTTKSSSYSSTNHTYNFSKTNLTYPCLQVFVKFTTKNGSSIDSQMFDNEEAFYKSECSFHPNCPSNTERSNQEIQDYAKKYGVAGETYQCYYNGHDILEVVRTTTKSSTYFHFFLWPSLVMVPSLGYILYAIISCVANLRIRHDPGTQEVYELQTENNTPHCPCNRRCGCSRLCRTEQEEMCYYRNAQEGLLGLCCRNCWKECLVGQFVNLDIQATNPFTVENTQLWYRPPSEVEFISFSQATTSRIMIRLTDIESSGLEPGDHVMWHRPYGIWHHAIVTEIGEAVLGVIQWADDECCSIRIHLATIRVNIGTFCKGDLYKVLYEGEVLQRNPPELVLARARSLLGTVGYKFFSRNCENMAVFCKSGYNFNHQYPWLIRRVQGLYQTALYLNFKTLLGATTFIKALLSEAVEFIINPAQEVIGAVIVLLFEVWSFVTDIMMIYNGYNVRWRNCCNFWRCYGSSNDFKKMVWMRIFEFFLGAGGMIGGSIGLEYLVRCEWSGLGHLLAVSVFGVIGGFVFGFLGKYLGNVIGYLVARYICYQPNR